MESSPNEKALHPGFLDRTRGLPQRLTSAEETGIPAALQCVKVEDRQVSGGKGTYLCSQMGVLFSCALSLFKQSFSQGLEPKLRGKVPEQHNRGQQGSPDFLQNWAAVKLACLREL